jgi:DinB superfamily
VNLYLTRILGLLNGRDPIEVLEKTPDRLEHLELDPYKRYGPDKWTAREILCHLADSELAYAFRLRQIAAGVEVVQSWDQEAWATRYEELSLSLAFQTFKATRVWNLAWLRGISRDDWKRVYQHPEHGPLSFEQQVRFMAGHDLNHLEQLEHISKLD